MTERRNRTHTSNYEYGICTNTGKCKLADSKKRQKVFVRKDDDFKCEECGEKLTKVSPPNSKKTAIIVIAAILIIGGGIALFSTSGDSSAPKQQPVTDTTAVVSQKDTATIQKQTETTVASEEKQVVENAASTQPKQEVATKLAARPNTEAATSNGTRLKCGKYEGPMSGGKPDGIGGTITVTSSYTIDLKDGNDGKVTLEAGDRISNTKFKNGILQQGQLIRSNGERKFMSGLSERL